MNELINEAAALIQQYDAPLAKEWLRQPFQRQNIAKAFAGGYKGSRGIAELLARVAALDVAFRSRAVDL